jgi:PhnB protein
MLSFNPYLNFMGNTEEAMNFYKTVLGGQFTLFQRYGDIPGGDKMPADDQQKINHISLTLPNGLTLMATDLLASMGQQLAKGNNFYICVNAESEKEVDRLFKGLSEGGKIEMPVNRTFWGAYFGMCADKFGIQWMLNYTYTKK